MAPGSRFGVEGAFERFVRLPYALPKPTLSEVVGRLAKAWDRVAVQGNVRRIAATPAELTAAI